MADLDNVKISVNPQITAGQLFSFYQRNNICEEGYGSELASKPLYHSSLIIGAFEGDKLVGITRAMFDGLSAVIMEFCLELKYQGVNLEYENGSLIGKDDSGLGKEWERFLSTSFSVWGPTSYHATSSMNMSPAFTVLWGLNQSQTTLPII